MKGITILSLLTNNIKNRVDQLSALSIMPLGPVIPGTRLPEHEVIGSEDLAKRASPDAVHGTGFEIHEDGARDIAATRGLVEIDIDALELKVWVGARLLVELAGPINAVLVADDFPEFGSDLVATLPTLNVQDLSHFFIFVGERRE